MHCNSWKNIEGKDQCRQLAPSRHPPYCTQFAANNRILPSLLLGSKFKIPNSRFQLPPVDILFTIPTLNRSTPEIASKFHTLTYPEEEEKEYRHKTSQHAWFRLLKLQSQCGSSRPRCPATKGDQYGYYDRRVHIRWRRCGQSFFNIIASSPLRMMTLMQGWQQTDRSRYSSHQRPHRR